MTRAPQQDKPERERPAREEPGPAGEPGEPVLHGQPVLDRLIALLDLEKIEENIFRGVSPAHSPVRVGAGAGLWASQGSRFEQWDAHMSARARVPMRVQVRVRVWVPIRVWVWARGRVRA